MPMPRSKSKLPKIQSAFPISERAREAMLDRLEAALIADELAVNGQLYAELLAALFPEDFQADPPLADEPTDTPPSSRERAAVYVRRARARRSLWHPEDAKATDSRSLRAEGGHRHARATSWDGEQIRDSFVDDSVIQGEEI